MGFYDEQCHATAQYKCILTTEYILWYFYRSSRSRKTKARHAAEEHRRQLQALLVNKSHQGGDVNGMNDGEDHHDDGTELLGSLK